MLVAAMLSRLFMGAALEGGLTGWTEIAVSVGDR